ncbi:hypothetical protein DPMN_055490 [Dreissena polymorpha]|uniref:Uncharacterized protein n=1 Tax=Dreissena polymorpha TaxID=45954 RepID=A0A9D4HSC5_DREPO|nr:hypothetical protein DPMN_055490 [Dreissena polymorpha]
MQETNVLTKLHDDWAKNRKLHHGGHVFPPIMTLFELVRDIYKSMFRKCPCFLPIRIIFELIRHFQTTHILTKFHEDWAKNVTSRKTAPPPGGHVSSPILTIFELVRDINETNLFTKFHDVWAKKLTSRVFTRNTAPPPSGHLHEDWASNVTSTVFTSRGINGTNVLTKFHEDRTINVASIVFTRQNVDAARSTTNKRRS